MSEERARRKLSGILSADAVGYSRLMQEDEASTIRNLEDSKRLMSELIEQFKGRVVDAPGDNLLAEFASVVDATECAVKIQHELKSRNAELPDNRKMEFRIGVNLGDVVEETDRIYGDGVNIASRIEGLAEPGGVCISRTAYDHVKNKLEVGYEYLGEHTVKNISEPVRVYRVLMDPGAAGKVIGEKRFLGKISRRAALSAIIILVIIAGGLIGKSDEAIPLIQEAIRRSPFDQGFYFLQLGHSYLSADRYEDAIKAYKKTLQYAPDNIFAYIGLTESYIFLNEEDKARETAGEVIRINPNFSVERNAKTLPFKDKARIARYVEALRKAGLK